MKKIVTVVVVLVLVLAVAPWGVGKLAEKRIDYGLDKLVEVAPYLKVVERKYTSGWFKSEQLVTFEVFEPWMRALSPKAIEEAMKKDGATAEKSAASDGDSANVAKDQDVAVSASPEASPPDAQPSADESAAPPEKPAEPLRFTVRNEILHGPVLGLAGFGIARVDSHLVLSDETRKKIAEIFGPKDPVEVTTRVGFFGGGTTSFKSEGRTIKPKGEKVEISWDTFKLAIGYSKNADTYDMDGKWPKLEVKNLDDKSHFVMTDMTIDGDFERSRGDLYDGDFTFAIDQMNVVSKDAKEFELKGLHYIVDAETKGDFYGMGAKFGTGEVKVKELTAMGIELKEVHYDFGLRRLHAPTLEKIMADTKELYAKPLVNVAELDKVIFAPFKDHADELLKYDPEFVIDRIGIVTADGDGFVKGVITLKGATVGDFGAGNMALIPKIHADITIDVSEKMVQKFPNGSTAAGAGVDSGYVKREGDRLICKILFVDGKLTVNGKPQAIPGLGGPPPQNSSSGGPPPQE
ncbi:MAG TPA: YdgA family protein [Steroidobacteraceae bacterium]|jgi:uncharacterized protein YdgA (DUF945 family)|nr:YdgA family protein [Steroidobacteraceae bacterium]